MIATLVLQPLGSRSLIYKGNSLYLDLIRSYCTMPEPRVLSEIQYRSIDFQSGCPFPTPPKYMYSTHHHTIVQVSHMLRPATYLNHYRRNSINRLLDWSCGAPSFARQITSSSIRLLPTSFLDSRNLTSQSIYTEIILWHNILAKLFKASKTFPLCAPHALRMLYEDKHTLVILKSLKTPRPFPPSIHLFRICVERV